MSPDEDFAPQGVRSRINYQSDFEHYKKFLILGSKQELKPVYEFFNRATFANRSTSHSAPVPEITSGGDSEGEEMMAALRAVDIEERNQCTNAVYPGPPASSISGYFTTPAIPPAAPNLLGTFASAPPAASVNTLAVPNLPGPFASAPPATTTSDNTLAIPNLPGSSTSVSPTGSASVGLSIVVGAVSAIVGTAAKAEVEEVITKKKKSTRKTKDTQEKGKEKAKEKVAVEAVVVARPKRNAAKK